MLNKKIFIILLSFTILFAQRTTGSQNFANIKATIKGIIKDTITNQPLEYANVILTSQRTKKIVGGNISNSNGEFIISDAPLGRHLLEVKFIGYNKYVKEIQITPQKTELDLGEIYLIPADKKLSEVLVTGKKEMMEFKLDKRVFNLDETTQNSGGNAADVLQNVPSVSVDIDGNVSLRGNSNVTILIDNRPVSLMGLSNADAMQQLPASVIERIEIVTNPSAKYDPDGTTGIINIITKKDNVQNYSALINLNVGNNSRYNGSLNYNYRYNSWNFFTSYNFRIMNMNFNNKSERTNFFPDTSLFNQYGDAKRKMNNHNIRLGTEYNFSNDHSLLLSLSYNIFNREMNSKTSVLNTKMPIEDYSSFSHNENKNNGFNINLNHRIKTNKDGANLITNINLSNFEEDGNSNTILNGIFQNNKFQGYTDGKTNVKNYTLQSDYTHPIDDFTQFETGFKIQQNNRSNDNLIARLSYSNKYNNFDFIEDFYSVYATYGSRFDNFKFQLGLRYEIAKIDFNQKTQSMKVKREYKNFFPTIHLSYDITTTNLIQLSYSRRLSRPNDRQLNPYIDSTDYPIINTGNPNILPEYYNSYELLHSIILGPSSINTSIFYRNTDDNVENLRYYYPDGSIVNMPKNLSKQESYGFEIVTQNNFMGFIRANLSYSYYKFVIRGGYLDNLGNYQNLSTNSFNWNVKLNSTITIQKGFDIMFNISYNSPRTMAQGKSSAFIHNDLSMRKNLIGDNLILTFRTFDPFKLMKFENTINTPYYTSFSSRTRTTTAFFIGLSYKINDFKRQKTNEDIPRDDDMQ